MSTPAQIEANRQNAQKSTGPKTPEGKAVASQNATTHGLRSNRLLITSDDPAEFAEHRTALLAELAPVGPMEAILANRIITLTWHLNRATRFQSGTLNALASDANEQKIEEFVLGKNFFQDMKMIKKVGITGDEYYDALGSDEKMAALQTRIRDFLCQNHRQEVQAIDSLEHLEDMKLGRIAFKDFSQTRVLERLLMYERRIENSLYKTHLQFQHLQLLRLKRQGIEQDKEPQAGD